MPEARASGRRRQSIGFPMVTLLLLGTLVLALAWASFEILNRIQWS